MDAAVKRAPRVTRSSSEVDIVVLCAEEEVRDVIGYWLSAQPVKVAVAADGHEAARALKQGARWLITDRVLPPWPGLDDFISLRGEYPDLQVVFVESGNLHDGILARVTGASALLPRPLTRQAVNRAISGVLTRVSA